MSLPEKKKPFRLDEQQVALTSYLAALLQDVPEYAEAPLPEPPAAAPESSAVTAPPQARAPEPVSVPEPPAPMTQAGADQGEPPAAEPGLPDWARERFQCLVFRVAGLSLAVPLTKLNGVIPWPESITPMPNRSELFLGLIRHQQRNVKVVDTALMVLPQGRQPEALAAPEERVEHIILLDEGRWGLACDAIGEVLTLEPDEVRWRSAQGKRPWLAGTVLKHLCALLDADAFVELLLHGEVGC